MERQKGIPAGSEPEPEPEPEHEGILRICAELLARRDFVGCREFTLRISRSDPNVSGCVDQVLAITDVLNAASRRLSNNHVDHYAVLQISRDAAVDRELARLQFKKLVRLLDPNKNKFPFSDDALMRVREAWCVLSDPAKLAQYECEIENSQPQETREHGGGGDAPNMGINQNGAFQDATFWTLCPYCWFMHEYEKKYEDFSLRCGNCRKTFHGVPVKSPAPEIVVEGKQQYYCYHVSLPLRYPVSEDNTNMGEHKEHFAYNMKEECGIGEWERGFQGNVVIEECVGVGQGNNEGTELQGNNKRRRFKTVANRVRNQAYLDQNSDSDLDADDGNLEFTEGDGDVFVGMKFQ